MSKQTRARLFLVLVLLGALTCVFAPPASQNAYAGICCDACENRYLSCLAGTLHPECGGTDPCCYNSTTCFHSCNTAC